MEKSERITKEQRNDTKGRIRNTEHTPSFRLSYKPPMNVQQRVKAPIENRLHTNASNSWELFFVRKYLLRVF